MKSVALFEVLDSRSHSEYGSLVGPVAKFLPPFRPKIGRPSPPAPASRAFPHSVLSFVLRELLIINVSVKFIHRQGFGSLASGPPTSPALEGELHSLKRQVPDL